MFDNYIFSDKSCKNVEKDGQMAGFELKTLIPYYRGIPLSMVHDVRVKVDGREVEREKIHFSADGDNWFTLSELETVTFYKWEYGQEAIVFVEQEEGLAKGEHEVTLIVAVRVAYIPVPFEGERTRKVCV